MIHSLEKVVCCLEIEIQSNEYFSVGMDTLSHFMVEMTAKPSKPRLWNSVFSYIFGDWGAKKCGLLCGMSDSLISRTN